MDCKYETHRACPVESLYPHKKIEQSKPTALFLMCHTLTDYRTIVEDFNKVVEFVEWLNENHPDKASYHTSKM